MFETWFLIPSLLKIFSPSLHYQYDSIEKRGWTLVLWNLSFQNTGM